jgi:hypothetical protein
VSAAPPRLRAARPARPPPPLPPPPWRGHRRAFSSPEVARRPPSLCVGAPLKCLTLAPGRPFRCPQLLCAAAGGSGAPRPARRAAPPHRAPRPPAAADAPSAIRPPPPHPQQTAPAGARTRTPSPRAPQEAGRGTPSPGSVAVHVCVHPPAAVSIAQPPCPPMRAHTPRVALRRRAPQPVPFVAPAPAPPPSLRAAPRPPPRCAARPAGAAGARRVLTHRTGPRRAPTSAPRAARRARLSPALRCLLCGGAAPAPLPRNNPHPPATKKRRPRGAGRGRPAPRAAPPSPPSWLIHDHHHPIPPALGLPPQTAAGRPRAFPAAGFRPAAPPRPPPPVCVPGPPPARARPVAAPRPCTDEYHPGFTPAAPPLGNSLPLVLSLDARSKALQTPSASARGRARGGRPPWAPAHAPARRAPPRNARGPRAGPGPHAGVTFQCGRRAHTGPPGPGHRKGGAPRRPVLCPPPLPPFGPTPRRPAGRAGPHPARLAAQRRASRPTGW